MLCPLAMLWALTFIVASGEAAVAPTSIVQGQPSLSPILAHGVHNTSILRGNPIIFNVPDTPINLHLSSFHGLINQGELNLCIIEGLGTIFEKVVAKGSDGGLPLHTWSSKWGNIIINIEDVRPPQFAMTYGYLVSTLRGIAFFTSQYGYVEMDVDVYHDKIGYIGTGYLGQIIPSQTL